MSFYNYTNSIRYIIYSVVNFRFVEDVNKILFHLCHNNLFEEPRIYFVLLELQFLKEILLFGWNFVFLELLKVFQLNIIT